MRVFVAGATGAIGRPLLARLRERGHEVCALTRSAERAGELRALGVDAAIGDALDADAVRRAVLAARPDAVVNQLTQLPRKMSPRAMKAALPVTNRLRTVGTANLVAAARTAGAERVVSQSVAFYYVPGSGPAREEEPLWTAAPGVFGDAVRGLAALERATLDGGGTVLRYGFFYGPGTWYAADGDAAEQLRRRRLPLIGRGDAVYSWVHVDDAAQTTVAALDRFTPGVFNVCDDEPALERDWAPAFAAAVGAPRPWRVPELVGRLAAGAAAMEWLRSLRGASNARAKEAFGVAPRPWRAGFAEL